MDDIQVSAVLFVDEVLLKEKYAESSDDYTLEDALKCEMRWVHDSGIFLKEVEITEGNIKALLFVDEDTLRASFLECNLEPEYEFEVALTSEMHWVNDSGITLGDFEVLDFTEQVV